MKFSWFALVLLVTGPLWAQTSLPRGFEDLTLGLSLKDVKSRLEKSGSFLYRGDPEVTLLREPLTNLLESDGVNYVLRGAFQFRSDRLVALTMVLNTRLLDYFSFFTSFSKKYGNPVRLDPSKAEWEDGTTLLILEKPLTVKYLDKQDLKDRETASQTEKAHGAIARELFLEKF